LERDEAAAATVLFWIEQRIMRGKNKRADPQIQEAAQWAAEVTLHHVQKEQQKAALDSAPPQW
jgi:hypothetical protein